MAFNPLSGYTSKLTIRIRVSPCQRKLSDLSDLFLRVKFDVMGFDIATLSKRHGLEERERQFITGVVIDCRSLGDAAEAAGYARSAAFSVMAMPRIAIAMREAVQIALAGETPLNLSTLREIRDNAKAPAGVRAEIALKLMRLAGFIEPEKAADSAPQKALSEMSGDELRRYVEQRQQEIDRLEGELAARATPISAPDSAPNETPADAKSKDYLD